MKKIVILTAAFIAIAAKSQILTNSVPVSGITNSSVILDASTNYSAEAGESNNKHKGIVIPSVDLINFEFDLSLANGITFPTYFDGMIVYNRATGTTLTTGNRSSTATAVSPGYYYFYNPNGTKNENVKGGEWRPMGSMASTTGADTTNDAWVNDAANNIVKLGTRSDGTARTAATDFVAKDNGSVGIGTSVPNNSALLDLTANNKGVLLPRVSLTGITDAVTIPSPATGLLAYNTSTTINGPGIVINRGTPSSPKWSSFQVYSDDTGAISGKLVYQSYPDPAKTVKVGNLEFRATYSGNNYYFQIRRLTPPSGTITYYCDRTAWYGTNNAPTTNYTVSFNSSNFSRWQTYTSGVISVLGNSSVGFLTYISSSKDSLFYRINNHSKFNSNSFTSFVIEAF